jgi:hypothetical protein
MPLRPDWCEPDFDAEAAERERAAQWASDTHFALFGTRDLLSTVEDREALERYQQRQAERGATPDPLAGYDTTPQPSANLGFSVERDQDYVDPYWMDDFEQYNQNEADDYRNEW